MTISFPLSLPNNHFQRLTIRNSTKVSTQSNMFSSAMQTYKWSGEMWIADVTLKPMKREDAGDWNALLVSLRGSYGTFLMGDPSAATPLGSASGTPVTDGAGQSGDVLLTKGWTPSQTGLLMPGDYIELDGHLHMVESQVDSDSGGLAAIDIFPRIRIYYGDEQPLVTSNTKGTWRLLDSDYQIYDADAGHVHSIGFTAFEDVPPQFGD